jgi:hypothetical protein
VPVGAWEITGVLVLELIGSLLLHAAKNTRPLRTMRNMFLAFILYRSLFIMFLGDRLAGDAIFTLNPTAEIDKLASLRTKGTERIIFPLDWLTAGWALH